MRMKIKMQLLSDTIFGNGMSVPGGEDMSVNHDKWGFPYYAASAFKGVLKEMLESYLDWGGDDRTAEKILQGVRCTDFELSWAVRNRILESMGDSPMWQEVLELFTFLRTFTAIDEDGTTKSGSLRSCRCLMKGLVFYGEVVCDTDTEKFLSEAIPLIRFVGMMRTRGFGQVRLEVIREDGDE